MTKLLEKAVAKVRRLPDHRQDEAAEILLSVVEQDPDSIQLSSQQIVEVERRIDERAEGVTHEEVRAFFRHSAG